MTEAADRPTRRLPVPGVLRRSLRARLVGSFLVLALISVAVIGLIVNARATDDLQSAVIDRLGAAADLKADAVERWLDEQSRTIVLVAGLLGRDGEGGGQPIRAFLQDEGDDAERRAIAASIEDTLRSVAARNPDARALLVLDRAGMIRLATDERHVGISQADEPYFVRGSTGTHVEGVFDSELTGESTIAASAPIFTSDGDRVGVLAVILDVVRVDRIIRTRVGLGGTGETFLVDSDGRLVSSAIGMAAGDEVTIPGVEQALAGRSGQGLYESQTGTPVIGVWRPLRDINSALVAEMTQQEAFAPARELARTIALVLVAAAGLLALGVAWISRAVTRPILGLAASASEVAHGNLDTTVPVTSEDEVGTLERAFNAMTAQLRENVENLERRVEERTAELNAALKAQGEAEARYRKLVEELPLTLYIDRPDEMAASIYTSPMIETMFGYPASAWESEEFFGEILHPDDRERVLRDHAEAFARGDERWSWDFRLIHADGRTVWVHDEAVVVKDEAGVPQYVQGFMQDVTDERTAAAEIRRQKQYFQELVDASPVAIVVMDRDEMVTAWNPAAERLFGHAAAEAVGRHIDDLIFAEDQRAEGAVTTTEARETGRAHRIGQRQHRDGHPVDVEIVVVPLMLDEEHVGYYAIYHDITELVEARKAAEAANQAKGAFLATMSHEIRTPMNAIIGMSGLLADTDLNPSQQEYADTIRTASEALLTIINDILDFSKIEAGRVELEALPFSPERVIEGALDVLAPIAAGKGVELAYQPGADVPAALLGDAGRLRQILLNLLSNAVKFTESGEVVLSASGRPLPDGRWEGTIEVRDTGIGIPPDRMDRLFQSFSQVDASVTRRYGGTGLGLAISRRLAELMDGELTAESSGVPGEGATFRLRFRVPVTDAVADAPPRRAGEIGGRRVLVVDDNATNRRILEVQGERWGMTVRSTESPKEALGWVEAGEAFDIALLDMQMPEMDGLSLATALRELRPDAPIPVLILSSVGADAVTEPSVRVALTKPVKPSALHDALADAFGVDAADGAPSAPVAAGDDARIGDLHPLRILLVEDNAMNRRLATILLDRMGYAADVATNGLEAIEAVERATYDVVLMDIQMPELDGLEATRRIRARWADGARPRIVALTANAMAEDRSAALEAGMDDYLSKPIRPDELTDALRRAERRTDA